jgi:hypothetical protein
LEIKLQALDDFFESINLLLFRSELELTAELIIPPTKKSFDPIDDHDHFSLLSSSEGNKKTNILYIIARRDKVAKK